MVNHQIIDDRETTLSLEDLAALREHLHEQRLFRQEQLQQLSAAATARADALLDRQASSQIEVRVKLAASARMVLADVEAALSLSFNLVSVGGGNGAGGFRICQVLRGVSGLRCRAGVLGDSGPRGWPLAVGR
ncbi:hypothetical protein [Streptomyces diastatochromogenes]|uniref:hypothetical protein n=1 Tax=Streptomyces diastatochromogenes TaxID=42236 RepID=UPI0036A02BAF